MRRHRRIAVLGLSALLLGACSGAGDDGAGAPATDVATERASEANDPEALHRVAEAAAATAEQGTVRFEVTVETEGTGGGDGMQPVRADGQEDFRAEQRQVTFRGQGGDLEALVDGTDIYVQVPGTETETWARVELDSLVAGDTGFGGPGGLPFRSSQDNLLLLQDAVTHAARGDEEDVRSQTATRYDLTVDLQSAADNAAESNDTMAALAQQSGVTDLDMQVWIGDDDLIRRVAYSIDLSQADVDAATEGAEVQADPAGTVTVTLEYFDFGIPVEIELPSDGQIIDIDEGEVRDSMTVPGAGEPTETGS